MKSIKTLAPYAILLVSVVIVFYKFFLFGLIPFPGDLLLSSYQPWKTYRYFGYNPGSYPTKNQYFDVVQQMYPWRAFTIASLKDKQLPLWNPYNFSGSPLLANHQSAIFYPLNILYLFIPQSIAWTLLIILQHVLMSWFMYLYLKKIGLSSLAGVFGAITFSNCLFMTTIDQYGTIGHTIVWLPLILWSIESIYTQTHIKQASITLFFGIFCMMTAGHLQTAGINIVISGLYILLRFPFRMILNKQGKIIWYTFLLIILGIGASGIQLIPTFELLHFSARASLDLTSLFHSLLLQPYQLIQLLIPDIFGNPATHNYLIPDTYATNAIAFGVIPFIFFFLGILQKKQPVVRIAILCALLIFTVTVNTPITQLLYRLPIPFLQSSSPSNIVFALSFFLIVIACFGLDAWVGKKLTTKRFIQDAFVCLIIIFSYLTIATLLHTPLSYKNCIFSIGILISSMAIATLSRFFPRFYIAIFFILITCGELFYFHAKFNPFVPHDMIYPDAPILTWLTTHKEDGRVWGYKSGALSANTQTIFQLSSPEGYDPLYAKRYGEFIYASQTGKLLSTFSNNTRSDAVIRSDEFETDSIPKRYTEKILDATSVTYVLDRTENASTEHTFPPERYESVYQKDGWNILRNKKALPRISFFPSYVVTPEKNDFEKTFFDERFQVQHTVTLDTKPIDDCCTGDSGTVRKTINTPNEITLTTRTNGSMILHLSDTYFPGWEAYVDRKETRIYRSNYTFRAIVVPEGTHTVTFIYKPKSLFIGTVLSFASLLIFAATLFINKKEFYHEKFL